MSAPLQDKIIAQLRRRGRGTVVVPKDFLDQGSRDAVDQALSRLTKIGVLRRLGRGLYSYPKVNKRLGITVPPSADEIANALARKTGSRVAPSGAMAANQLGLSTQVPAKPVYLTDGRSRQTKVNGFVVIVKHVGPKELPAGNSASAAVFQALRYLGKDAVDSTVIDRIRHILPPKDRAKLLHDAKYTTDWIAEAARKIACDEAASHG